FALGLDVRQLQLLTEDRRQLVHRDLDLEQMLAWLVAGLALGVLRIFTEYIPRIAVALPHPARLLRPETKMRNVNLRQRDGDKLLALLAEHLPLRNVLAQVLFDFSANDLAKSPVILID